MASAPAASALIADPPIVTPRVLIYAPEALADLDAAPAWLTQPGSGPEAWRGFRPPP